MKKINLREIPFRSDEYRDGFLAGFKWFVIKEIHRHNEDIESGCDDLRALEDVILPPGLDVRAWYEVRGE